MELLSCVILRVKDVYMAGNQHSPTVISFGPFEADLHTQELTKLGVRLRLPGQSFQILSMLLKHPGELVTREELQQALWPSDTHVDFERGVNAAVNRLRDVMGDSADNPTFIETLPRRGYRLIALVKSRSDGQITLPSPVIKESEAPALSAAQGAVPGKRSSDAQQPDRRRCDTNSDRCCGLAQPAAAADRHQHRSNHQRR
jgi:DNA-binding winged helix-turn-helix (wHTH) protein